MSENVSKQDLEKIVEMLDRFAMSEEGQMKVFVKEDRMPGRVEKVHHHGRCDIGSPYATGECFDAPEALADEKY